jgi:hypothetical protein
MKRSEISITLRDRIKELSAEATQRWARFQKQVKENKMSRYTANKKYLIIQEQLELLETLNQKGYSFRDLQRIVDDLPDYDSRGVVKQNKIQFPI